MTLLAAMAPCRNRRRREEQTMLTVLSDGDGKYRLEDNAGMASGWINGRAIGFRGFADERAAREAAIDGWRALDATLRQQFAGWREHEPVVERLRTVHDGAYEWFYDGTSAIARLLRPQRRAWDSTFGIQFVLPTYATDATMISAALNIAAVVAPYRDLPSPVAAPSRSGDAAAAEHAASRQG
jgi:hypothetical protein